MKLKLFVASLLAAVSFGAVAADQAVVITTGQAYNFAGFSTVDDVLLSGGMDVITFTGLAAGVYNVDLTMSALNMSFGKDTTFNGESVQLMGSKKRFMEVEYNGNSPFVLNLFGSYSPANAAIAAYSGQISVTAVPEPETYGMLLAGLGLVGFAARRKAKKAA